MPVEKAQVDKVITAFKLLQQKGLQPLTPEEQKQLEARRAPSTPQTPSKPRGS